MRNSGFSSPSPRLVARGRPEALSPSGGVATCSYGRSRWGSSCQSPLPLSSGGPRAWSPAERLDWDGGRASRRGPRRLAAYVRLGCFEEVLVATRGSAGISWRDAAGELAIMEGIIRRCPSRIAVRVSPGRGRRRSVTKIMMTGRRSARGVLHLDAIRPPLLPEALRLWVESKRSSLWSTLSLCCV